MNKTFDYSFVNHYVDLQNIGQHDMDNSFIFTNFIVWQFPAWQARHEWWNNFKGGI